MSRKTTLCIWAILHSIHMYPPGRYGEDHGVICQASESQLIKCWYRICGWLSIHLTSTKKSGWLTVSTLLWTCPQIFYWNASVTCPHLLQFWSTQIRICELAILNKLHAAVFQRSDWPKWSSLWRASAVHTNDVHYKNPVLLMLCIGHWEALKPPVGHIGTP